MLKIVGLLIIALIIFGAGYPLLNEDTNSACGALERRIIFLLKSPKDNMIQTMVGKLLGNLSRGAFASTAVKDKHPNLPAFVGCSVEYWNLLINPERIQSLNLR